MRDHRERSVRHAPSREILERLRREIGGREGGHARFGEEPVRLGCAALDGVLPWGGLPRHALHEVTGTAATGFAAALAVRALDRGGHLVWCTPDARARRWGEPYAPGLAALGLDHRRLLLVRCPDEGEMFRAMEEALRCPAVHCALGEFEHLDLRSSRRLQLAAEKGGGIGLLLGPRMFDPAPIAALTRFRAEPFLLPRGRAFAVDLWRVRGGSPWSRVVQWDAQTLSFTVVAGSSDRTDATGRTAAG